MDSTVINTLEISRLQWILNTETKRTFTVVPLCDCKCLWLYFSQERKKRFSASCFETPEIWPCLIFQSKGTKTGIKGSVCFWGKDQDFSKQKNRFDIVENSGYIPVLSSTLIQFRIFPWQPGGRDCSHGLTERKTFTGGELKSELLFPELLCFSRYRERGQEG